MVMGSLLTAKVVFFAGAAILLYGLTLILQLWLVAIPYPAVFVASWIAFLISIVLVKVGHTMGAKVGFSWTEVLFYGLTHTAEALAGQVVRGYRRVAKRSWKAARRGRSQATILQSAARGGEFGARLVRGGLMLWLASALVLLTAMGLSRSVFPGTNIAAWPTGLAFAVSAVFSFMSAEYCSTRAREVWGILKGTRNPSPGGVGR
jgi:uncharacterized membrane protein YczE